MPTYQYLCKACGEGLEAVQSFHDPALTECPACGGELRKVFSSVGVVFKGSGFYRTDSRSAASTGGGASDKAKPASTAASTDSGSSTPKADAKPASTAKSSSGDSAA